MRRKLIVQGKKSFTVTLPIDWIKRHKIKDEVELEIKNGYIEIKPITYKEQIKTKKIDITDFPNLFIARTIGACYKVGYDEIILIYKNEQLEIIKEIVKGLIGYEIIETKPVVVIKRIGAALFEEYNTAEKKIFQYISSTLQDFLEGIKTKNIELIKSVIESDVMMNRFADYCQHLLLKYRNIESDNPFVPFVIAYQLEKAADIIKEIAKEFIQEKFTMPSKAALALHESLNKLASEFYFVYYEPRRDKIIEFINNIIKLRKEFKKYKPKTAEISYVNGLKQITDIFYWLITPIIMKRFV